MNTSLVVRDRLGHDLSLSADQTSNQGKPENGKFHRSRLIRVSFAVKAVFTVGTGYELTKLEARLIASAKMTVLNKNERRAWTSDNRRMSLEVIATSET